MESPIKTPEIQIKTLDGKTIGSFPLAPLLEAVKAILAPDAKLAEEQQAKDAEIAHLQEQVAELESPEHRHQIISEWLNGLEGADPEQKVALGVKLGLDQMFREANVAEEAPLEATSSEPPAPKPFVVFADPADPAYVQSGLAGVWIRR